MIGRGFIQAAAGAALFFQALTVWAQTPSPDRPEVYVAGNININSIQPGSYSATGTTRMTVSDAEYVSTETGNPYFTPTGEIFYDSLKPFTQATTSLVCEASEDRCLGCRSNSYRGASMDRVATSNAETAFYVVNRYYIFGLNTPVYNGNHVITINPDTQYDSGVIFDMAPHIRRGQRNIGSFSCHLQGIDSLYGFLSYPSVGNDSFRVTEDCKIIWIDRDTGTTPDFIDIGAKYVIQVIIQEEGSHLTTDRLRDVSGRDHGQRNDFCRGYNQVDLMLVVGCESGDLDCLGCNDLPTGPILESIDRTLAVQYQDARKLLLKAKRLHRKAKRDMELGGQSSGRYDNLLFHRRGVRLARRMIKGKKIKGQEGLDLLMNSTNAKLSDEVAAVMTSCTRPSSFFCVNKSNDALIEAKKYVAERLLWFYTRAIKMHRKYKEKALGQHRSLSRGELRKLDQASYKRNASLLAIEKFPKQVSDCSAE